MFQKAEWIWLDRDHYPDDQESAYTFFCDRKQYCVATFIKEFSVDKSISAVCSKISADCKYRLKVNGQTVSHGPAAVGGDYDNTEPLGYRFVDEPHITLRTGNNTLQVDVVLQPTVESDYSDGHGGLIFETSILYDDQTTDLICTDDTWIAYKNNSYIGDYMTDFTEASDTQTLAQVTDDIWNLETKNIPELGRQTILPVDGQRYRVAAGEKVTIDFGKVYSGYFRMDGVCHTPNKTKMTTSFFERENFPIVFRDSGKETVYLDSIAFAFENLHLRSARYVEIEVEEGLVEFMCTWAFVSYPVESKGYFRCSDAQINKIYDVCVRTTQLCMNTYHMDSPVHQEAIGCTGDYLIQSLIGYYAYGDYKLTRLDLVRDARYFRLKNGHRLHTSYGMIWVQWLYDYVLYSGDTSIYHEVLDALDILMDRYEKELFVPKRPKDSRKSHSLNGCG